MRTIRSFWTRICGWALGILGLGVAVSGCRVMYGTPTMDFEIKGKVVDAESGKPVEGVQVERAIPYTVVPDITDAAGNFDIIGQTFPNDTLTLKVVDIDGADGGLYETQKNIVHLKQTGKGSGSWYSGKFEATDVEIKIKKVSE